MNVISQTIQQLNSAEWYGISGKVERTKGKYKIGNRKRKIKRWFWMFFR